MDDGILRVAILSNVMSVYRRGFYDRLSSVKDLDITVYCQDRIPGMNIKTIHTEYPRNFRLVKFIAAKREKATWQFIPWKEVFTSYDVVFVEGNPRNLSHALLATCLRIAGKKVVLWTMAHSFRNSHLTENFRLLWTSFFKFLLVYTDAEVDFLRSKGFRSHYILGQNNGLDQKKIDSAISMWTADLLKEWRVVNNVDHCTVLLSCARLDPKNKFEQFVQALPFVLARIPETIWCVIGAGSEEKRLKGMVTIAGLSRNVRFVGELHREEELAPWFLSSELLVHPAAIGLSLMHAFGYGLPVVTHNNAGKHNPEYAAFEPELTGRNFREDDIQNLADTVIDLVLSPDKRAKMKTYAQQIAREKFNVDIMVTQFVAMAQRAYLKDTADRSF